MGGRLRLRASSNGSNGRLIKASRRPRSDHLVVTYVRKSGIGGRLVQSGLSRKRRRTRPGGDSHPREACTRPSQRDERNRSEEHTSELQSQSNLVCRLLLEKKK